MSPIILAAIAFAVSVLMLAVPRPGVKIALSGAAAGFWFAATFVAGREVEHLAAAFVTLVFGSLTVAYGLVEISDAAHRRREGRSSRPPFIIAHRDDVDGDHTVTIERVPAVVEAAVRFGARPDEAGLLAIVERHCGKFRVIAATERTYQGDDLRTVASAHARRRGASYVPGGIQVQDGPAPVTYVATMGPQATVHTDPRTLKPHATLAVGTLRVRFDHSETARSWARALLSAAIDLEQALADRDDDARIETEAASR